MTIGLLIRSNNDK